MREVIFGTVQNKFGDYGAGILAAGEKRTSIRSLMMDIATLENFRSLIGPGEKAGKAPINLTDGERSAYEVVARETLRLEQEKIPQVAALTSLKKLSD